MKLKLVILKKFKKLPSQFFISAYDHFTTIFYIYLYVCFVTTKNNMTLNYYCFIAELPLPFHNISYDCFVNCKNNHTVLPPMILTIMIYYMQYIIFTFFVNIVIGIFVNWAKYSVYVYCKLTKKIIFLCTLEIWGKKMPKWKWSIQRR